MIKSLSKLTILVAGLLITNSAFAGQYGELAQKGFAYWKCAALADITKQDSKETFFNMGLGDLKEALSAAMSGKTTTEDQNKFPIGISIWAGGPNVDFALGSLWQGLSSNIFDETRPKNWLMMVSEDWQAIQKQTAVNNYHDSNCHIMKSD